jgi:hypothetical protein
LLTIILKLFIYYIGDTNRDKIDPDLLMQGVDGVNTIIKEENTLELFDFLRRNVRKTHTDDLISKKLRASPGISYLDVIRPGDIAYVIALMKNAREVWDQDLRLSAAGEAAMASKEPKKKLKFTGGKRQNRMKGKRLWNVKRE